MAPVRGTWSPEPTASVETPEEAKRVEGWAWSRRIREVSLEEVTWSGGLVAEKRRRGAPGVWES